MTQEPIQPDGKLTPLLVDAVRETVSSLQGDITAGALKVLAQVEAIAADIAQMRDDLVALRPKEIKDVHLTTASCELDAVVTATEKATGDILDAVEIVEQISVSLEGDQQAALMDAVMRIYEACNFQDITGQRIQKVVKAMKLVESRVDRLMGVIGAETESYQAEAEATKAPDEDAFLMNGPQMPDQAMNQDEIDALLADFD